MRIMRVCFICDVWWASKRSLLAWHDFAIELLLPFNRLRPHAAKSASLRAWSLIKERPPSTLTAKPTSTLFPSLSVYHYTSVLFPSYILLKCNFVSVSFKSLWTTVFLEICTSSTSRLQVYEIQYFFLLFTFFFKQDPGFEGWRDTDLR